MGGEEREFIVSVHSLASLACNSYCQGNGSDEILGRRNTKSSVKKYKMFSEEIEKVWRRNEISLVIKYEN